jgi:hypothetical protein
LAVAFRESVFHLVMQSLQRVAQLPSPAPICRPIIAMAQGLTKPIVSEIARLPYLLCLLPVQRSSIQHPITVAATSWASFHGARIQLSSSASVVRITGMAFGITEPTPARLGCLTSETTGGGRRSPGSISDSLISSGHRPRRAGANSCRRNPNNRSAPANSRRAQLNV